LGRVGGAGWGDNTGNNLKKAAKIWLDSGSRRHQKAANKSGGFLEGLTGAAIEEKSSGDPAEKKQRSKYRGGYDGSLSSWGGKKNEQTSTSGERGEDILRFGGGNRTQGGRLLHHHHGQKKYIRSLERRLSAAKGEIPVGLTC